MASSSSEVVVKLSSKGQVVIPREMRRRLGLKKGDKLKVEIDEQSKQILIQPSVQPPREVFVKAGTRLTSSILNESRELDEAKVKKLLKAIGAR